MPSTNPSRAYARPLPGGAGSIRNPTPARNGLSSASLRSHGLTRPHHPLDADGGGLPKGNPQTIVIGKSGLDDLLLYLAVQGQRDLGAGDPHIDQRVLLGQLGQGLVQAGCLGGPGGDDHRFQVWARMPRPR